MIRSDVVKANVVHDYPGCSAMFCATPHNNGQQSSCFPSCVDPLEDSMLHNEGLTVHSRETLGKFQWWCCMFLAINRWNLTHPSTRFSHLYTQQVSVQSKSSPPQAIRKVPISMLLSDSYRRPFMQRRPTADVHAFKYICEMIDF
jgi:hypothetical protein